MKLASLLILIAAAMVSQVSGADWEYPTGGRTTTIKHIVGKAGKFDSYQTLTKDSPEKVVLWYAKQLGFSENKHLVRMAKAGFHTITKPHSTSDVLVRDTDKEKWGAVILSSLSAEHANVQIFVRPENDPKHDITISIDQTAKGTLVTVIQSLPSEAKKNVAKAK